MNVSMHDTASDSEQLTREINLLLDYNPPKLPSNHKAPKLINPLSFYDKHLDERLLLKRVITVPSFPVDLAKPVDRAFQLIKEQNLSLPAMHLGDVFPTQETRNSNVRNRQIKDAQGVGRVYQWTTARFSGLMASMLSLHPRAPLWRTTLGWRQHRETEDRTTSDGQPALYEDYGLELDFDDGILKLPMDVRESMEHELWEDVNQVFRRFSKLGVWQIFFPSRDAEKLLKDMDKLTSMPVFPTVTPRTLGYWPPSVTLRHSPDALDTSWGIPVSSFIVYAPSVGFMRHCMNGEAATSPSASAGAPGTYDVSLRRSARIMRTERVERMEPLSNVTSNIGVKPRSATKNTPSTSDNQWPNITLPPHLSARGGQSRAAAVIQHAWSSAVANDSTFIILHSGDFERIGFRHRESQTLYLSELIDVSCCKDPAYGKLHIGLYMSIIEDALDRTRQIVQCETKIPNNRKKRQRDTLDSFEANKRPRTRGVSAKEAMKRLQSRKPDELVVKELATRPLLLLRIQHGQYNSPAPSSFLRLRSSAAVGKTTYAPTEYLWLTITSALGAGATGEVHAATAELLVSNGATLRMNVVVKLALQPYQGKRMRHEFSVYQHLAASSVGGIPEVFGLFQDVESSVLAMVMTNVGTCVWDRRPDKSSSELGTFSRSERAAFIRVMSDIHHAGVRHRDIRPENMVIDDDGTAKIIDFDRADMTASEDSRQRELEHLLALLEGDYTFPGDVTSLRTPGKHFSSESD